MNILGIGAFEVLVIFLIAFLILGPEKMCQFSKKFGNFVKKIRAAISILFIIELLFLGKLIRYLLI